MTSEYPIGKRNEVKQLRQYARYERDAVQQILAAGLLAHVAFVQDEAPVVVPMIYGVEEETLYLHGARKSRIIKLLDQNEDVCVNVTLVDGLILARSAFNSSMRYRSVTVFGKPQLLESAGEKLHAMRIISEHSMPGRWDELRRPLDREIKMTGVIAVHITEASAKTSNGMPDDEDDDYGIPVWAGVLPLQTAFGSLVDDDRLLPGVEPSAAVKSLQGRSV